MISTRKRPAAAAGLQEVADSTMEISRPPCGVEGCEEPSDVAMLGMGDKTLMACKKHIYDAMIKVMDGGPVEIALWTRLFHPEGIKPQERPAMDVAVALAAQGIGSMVIMNPSDAFRRPGPKSRASRRRAPK